MEQGGIEGAFSGRAAARRDSSVCRAGGGGGELGLLRTRGGECRRHPADLFCHEAVPRNQGGRKEGRKEGKLVFSKNTIAGRFW